jgi:hypothetical protein
MSLGFPSSIKLQLGAVNAIQILHNLFELSFDKSIMYRDKFESERMIEGYKVESRPDLFELGERIKLCALVYTHTRAGRRTRVSVLGMRERRRESETTYDEVFDQRKRIDFARIDDLTFDHQPFQPRTSDRIVQYPFEIGSMFRV